MNTVSGVSLQHTYTRTHTHAHIHLYIYIECSGKERHTVKTNTWIVFVEVMEALFPISYVWMNGMNS